MGDDSGLARLNLVGDGVADPDVAGLNGLNNDECARRVRRCHGTSKYGHRNGTGGSWHNDSQCPDEHYERKKPNAKPHPHVVEDAVWFTCFALCHHAPVCDVSRQQ